jgi:arabinose-5-phosphate isomerase
MITGDRMPLVSDTESFKSVINTISEYKLGMAMIVDEHGYLLGVLTDGDIRRTIIKYQNTSDLSVKDVMTSNPKRITEDAYAASALNLMEKYSITALAVVDSNNLPVGVIHVHDLLRAGVA